VFEVSAHLDPLGGDSVIELILRPLDLRIKDLDPELDLSCLGKVVSNWLAPSICA